MTKKPVKESTSSRIASIAARGMKKPSSLTLSEIKSVCASCVTQYEKAVAAKKRAAKKKKARKV